MKKQGLLIDLLENPQFTSIKSFCSRHKILFILFY